MVVVCSLICIIYMALLLREKYRPHERKLQKGALVFFLLFTGIFIGAMLNMYAPKAYVILAPLLYVCLTGSWSSFYYIVFTLTSEGQGKRFPPIHLVLPLVMPVILAVWMPFVPFEVPLGIVKVSGILNPEWPVFSRLFTSFMPVDIVFATIYLTLSLTSLSRYRRALPKRKRESSLYRIQWVNALIALLGIAWLFSIFAVLTSPKAVFSTHWFIASAAAAMVAMEIVLLYNLQRHNYPPLDMRTIRTRGKTAKKRAERDAADAADAPLPQPCKVALKHLSQKDFDNYFRHEKPYLDTGLKLTSLAIELGISREELSAFVNRTYGVNFNVFVNRWRLRELDRQRRLGANKDATLKSLLPQAGFASYNSYMRARQAADEKADNHAAPKGKAAATAQQENK